MRALLYQWLKTNRVMLVNAGSLIGTTLVTGAMGFAYWWIADRQFRPADVGLASASISAMMLLGALSVLGQGTLLIGELPRHPGKEASLISAALLLVGTVGGIIGILFALVAPFTSADFQPLRANIGNVLIFASGVSLTSITIVLDQSLVGHTLFAAAKLAVLFAIATSLRFYGGGVSIYATWAIGSVISLLPLVVFFVIKQRSALRRALPDWGLLRRLGSSALQHHMLNLILQVPMTTLPVLVTILLSATENAWFYTTWMLTGFVSVASYSLSTVLYAINSGQNEELARKLRMTLGLALITCIAAAVVLQIGASQVLGLFGQLYAEKATLILRILIFAEIPMIIKHHYIAVRRIGKRLTSAMLPVAFGSLLELGAATLGAHLGALPGFSIGWVIAVYIEGIFMAPTVYKAARFKFSSATEREAAQLLIDDEYDEMEETQPRLGIPRFSAEWEETQPRLSTPRFSAAFSISAEWEDTLQLARVSARSSRQSCPQCHAQLGVNADFCSNCGAQSNRGKSAETRSRSGQLSAETRSRSGQLSAVAVKEPMSLHELICPHCNTVLPTYAKFCSACGWMCQP